MMTWVCMHLVERWRWQFCDGVTLTCRDYQEVGRCLCGLDKEDGLLGNVRIHFELMLFLL